MEPASFSFSQHAIPYKPKAAMSRKTHGFFPVFPRPLVVFLLAVCLFTGCIASPSTDEEPVKPGVEVSATFLDFSQSLESLSFTVTLTGGETEWTLVSDELPVWCTATVERRKSGDRVIVRVDRAKLFPGDYTSSLTVKWASGSQVIDIRMVVPEYGKDTGTILIDTKLPE